MKSDKYKRKNIYKRGMTYVELIVVLGIFAMMTSIMMFNYGDFQARVDLRNITSDMALKIVQAQKYSVSGNLPSLARQAMITIDNWKPSYGVYFDRSASDSFLFFTDLDQNKQCDGTCTSLQLGEFVEGVRMNNNIKISKMTALNASGAQCSDNLSKIYVSFTRPYSEATLFIDPIGSCPVTAGGVPNPDRVQISVVSDRSSSIISNVTVYKSGRIQVN